MGMNGQSVASGSCMSAALISAWALDELAPAGSCLCVLQVPAEFPSLTLVEKTTESLCSEIPLGASVTDAIVLSVSEAMNNALRHGNLSGVAPLMLIRYYQDEDVLQVCLSDTGNALPETLVRRYCAHIVDMPLTTGLTEDLPEGGWGVNLILQGCTSVSYQRVATLNHLTLSFALKD